MSTNDQLQAQLAEAKEELDLLMRPVGQRDRAGKTCGPGLDPAKLQRIEALEDRIAELKAQLIA